MIDNSESSPLHNGANAASSILKPYTVLDLTRVRAGPTCVRQLADWGANVIKIEAPGADDMGGARDSSDFQNLQRNKRSITLNLKHQLGLEVFNDLAANADVVVENYRPAVKHRLGIDYESLHKINPKLIYASVSGFGQDGPLAQRPGFDQIAQGMAGLMSITGEPEHGPMRVGIPIADLCAGVFAAQGVLLALLARERSGVGQWVQSSLLQAQLFMLDFQAARWLMDGEVAQQAGNDHPTVIPTGVFETADGHINIACAGQEIWQRLRDHLNDQRLHHEQFATANSRSENRKPLNALINEHTRKHSSASWIEALNNAGVPCGEINTIDQAFSMPQVKHLEMAKPMHSNERGETCVVGQPVILSNAESSVTQPPPAAGQHTQEILQNLGYSSERISALTKAGVI